MCGLITYQMLLASLSILILGVYGRHGPRLPRYHTIAEEVSFHPKPIIPILKHSYEMDHESYQFSYETGNGIHAQESGFIKNKGDKEHEILVQQGSITYHDEHGHPITLTYIADENGFQPQGAHLPTPPPIPAEIQKALQENAHQEQSEHVIQSEPEEKTEYEQQPELNHDYEQQIADYGSEQ